MQKLHRYIAIVTVNLWFSQGALLVLCDSILVANQYPYSGGNHILQNGYVCIFMALNLCTCNDNGNYNNKIVSVKS